MIWKKCIININLKIQIHNSKEKCTTTKFQAPKLYIFVTQTNVFMLSTFKMSLHNTNISYKVVSQIKKYVTTFMFQGYSLIISKMI